MPRIGARKVWKAATGSANMLTAALPVPATFVPTSFPNVSVPPATLRCLEFPKVEEVTHCSLSKKLVPSPEPQPWASVLVLQYRGAPLPAVKIGATVHPPNTRPASPCCDL